MPMNFKVNPIVIQGPASGSLASALPGLTTIVGIAHECPSPGNANVVTLTRIGLPTAELALAYRGRGPLFPVVFPSPLRHEQGFRFQVIGSGTLHLFL